MSNLTDRIVSIAEELDALAGDLESEEKRGDGLYKLANSMLEELAQVYGFDSPIVQVFRMRLKQLRRF